MLQATSHPPSPDQRNGTYNIHYTPHFSILQFFIIAEQWIPHSVASQWEVRAAVGSLRFKHKRTAGWKRKNITNKWRQTDRKSAPSTTNFEFFVIPSFHLYIRRGWIPAVFKIPFIARSCFLQYFFACPYIRRMKGVNYIHTWRF